MAATSAVAGETLATRISPSPVFLRSPTPTQAPSQPPLPVTPIGSLLPSPSPTFTSTPLFSPRGFNTPIGGYYKFVVHKAREGERLEPLAEQYGTTVEAMTAVNYHLTNPPWADMIFVIPVGFSEVEGLPMFVVYQIKPEERGISMDALAKKLRVDLFDLKYYNGMMEAGQRPLVGDLILVPWFPDQNRKIILDPPDDEEEERK